MQFLYEPMKILNFPQNLYKFMKLGKFVMQENFEFFYTILQLHLSKYLLYNLTQHILTTIIKSHTNMSQVDANFIHYLNVIKILEVGIYYYHNM
jgi:hypothetical protein